MIEKKVYYCWFGGKKPEAIQNRISMWKQMLTDYEFIEINEQNFDYNKYQFTQDAYKAKKFAYVSDVARLEFLNQTGGVYLDTDVDVLGRFDSFLADDTLQLSMEYYGYEITGVNVGTIISPAHHPILETVKTKLIESTYSDTRPTVNVYFNQALPELVYKDKMQTFGNQRVKIYPSRIFCKKSKQSITIHQYDNSWGEKLTKSQKIKRLCGVLVKKVIGRSHFEKIHKKEN